LQKADNIWGRGKKEKPNEAKSPWQMRKFPTNTDALSRDARCSTTGARDAHAGPHRHVTICTEKTSANRAATSSPATDSGRGAEQPNPYWRQRSASMLRAGVNTKKTKRSQIISANAQVAARSACKQSLHFGFLGTASIKRSFRTMPEVKSPC
jgi:hypothetical protein